MRPTWYSSANSDPVKGIDVLIDAIAGLHRDGSAITATLVGDGSEAAALNAQVSDRGLDRAIRFTPPMPARAAMALGRIMVIPSRAESLPYVVLEAAAAGKPLITTSVGGIPEIYGALSDALVPAGDVQVLAAAIAGAVDDPSGMLALAQKLRARVAAAFSADAMVDGVLAGYEPGDRPGACARPGLAVSRISEAAPYHRRIAAAGDVATDKPENGGAR